MKNFITISAPSGTGKTTLCKAIQKKNIDINWSISYTTREKREIERNGIDYHFISKKEFRNLIRLDHFIEWESVHGFYYGTSKKTLQEAIDKNNILLIEIDVKGALNIKKLYPNQTFSIFIMPPSIEHLRERLQNRGTDSNKRIDVRLKRFGEEIKLKNSFDCIILNEHLDKAKKELIKMINNVKENKYGFKNNTIS